MSGVRLRKHVPGRDAAGDRPGLAGLLEKSERSLASDAAIYALATYVAQALIFVAGVAQKGLLGPENTGYWTLMGTAWAVFGIFTIGVVNGGVRQIPHYRGQKNLGEAATTADTAFTFSQLVISCTGLVVAAVAVAFGDGWPGELRWGLVLVGVTAPLRNLVDCHEMLLQATKRFVPLSLGLIIKATATLVIQTGLVFLFGYYGMFAGLVALNLAALALWRRLHVSGPRNPAFRRRLARSRVRELVRIGIPLFVFGQSWALFLVVDSVIVAGLIGVRELGYYALAVSVTSYIILLPRSIAQTIFPRMQERYSASSDAASIRRYATDTQLVLAFMFVPPLIAAAYFLLPVLIRQVLPAFQPAIGVIHIIVAGSFLIALVHMPVQLMIAIGRRWTVTTLMLAGLGLNAGGNYLAIAVLDAGIEGAAYATVLSYAALFAAVSLYAFAAVIGWRRTFVQIRWVMTSLASTLLVILGLETVIGPGGGGPARDLGINVGKVIVSVALLVPWSIYAERRYGALSVLLATIRSMAASVRSRVAVARADG